MASAKRTRMVTPERIAKVAAAMRKAGFDVVGVKPLPDGSAEVLTDASRVTLSAGAPNEWDDVLGAA